MDPKAGGIDRLDALDDAEDTEVTEVEVTRARIEQTRSEMGDTIEAIKDKLNPQVLAQQAKDTVHDVTADLAQQAKETVHAVTSDVVQQAKENLPEMTANMAHQAVGSAVNTAKEAVGGAVDSAKDAVGGAVESARDAGSSVLEMIQRNPIPAALIGLGLSWLYMSARSRNSATHSYSYREVDRYDQPGRYDDLRRYDRVPQSGEQQGTLHAAKEAVGGAVDTAKDAVGSAVGTAREAVGGAIHTAREKAGDAVDTARDAGSSVVGMIQQNPIPAALMATGLGWLLMGNRGQHPSRPFMDRRYADNESRSYATAPQYGEATESLSRSGETWRQGSYSGSAASSQGRSATGMIQRTLQQNPVAAGAVALGLGAGLGLLLPETRQENRWMGEAKERIVEKAQETAQDIGMKVQIVAEEAVEAAKGTAKQEAKNQGLSSSSS